MAQCGTQLNWAVFLAFYVKAHADHFLSLERSGIFYGFRDIGAWIRRPYMAQCGTQSNWAFSLATHVKAHADHFLSLGQSRIFYMFQDIGA